MLCATCFAKANPEAFTPDQAVIVDNLDALLDDLDRHGEALAVTQEAVQLRGNAREDSPTHIHDRPVDEPEPS